MRGKMAKTNQQPLAEIKGRTSIWPPQNSPARILERAIIDTRSFEIILLTDEGKFWGFPFVTILMDEFSGYPLGYALGFNPTSRNLIFQCIYNSILPKPDMSQWNVKNSWMAHGLMKNIATKDIHIHRALRSICPQLAINLSFIPPLSHLDQRLFRLFEEITFAVNKLQTVGSVPAKFTGQSSTERIPCIKKSEFLKCLLHVSVDHYSQSLLGGEMPSVKWLHSLEQGQIIELPYEKNLYELLHPSETRTLRKRGIQYMGNYYWSEEVNHLLDTCEKGDMDVAIRADSDDMRIIYVSDPNTVGNWIKAYIEFKKDKYCISRTDKALSYFRLHKPEINQEQK
jgi:putative transposase